MNNINLSQPISINQMIFVTVKCCVFFEVRTEFLHIILMNFGFTRFNSVRPILTVRATIHFRIFYHLVYYITT
jgi:hypothetical protein